MPSTLAKLRALALSRTLFPETSLAGAMRRLGFVQADPIKRPATAQDLILRHRVKDYSAGELERSYPSLELDEDYLYAYGFVDRGVGQVLHPRVAAKLSKLERGVLDAVRAAGRVHPRELERSLGAGRVVNAWGGRSKATTQALDALHYRGLVRVAARERGIRIYEPMLEPQHGLSPGHRLLEIARAVAGVLAPIPSKRLRSMVAGLGRRVAGLSGNADPVGDMIASGELLEWTADGIDYVGPQSGPEPDGKSPGVRLLAPFDPVVWDRTRFEHLWGWPYRFEAYTPKEKRVRGYYALPLLWRDAMIGWANVAVAGGALDAQLGFAGARPRSREFTAALDEELARLAAFLAVRPAAVRA